MNAFIKISAVAAASALFGIAAQAQVPDNVASEVFGVALPTAVAQTPAPAARVEGLSRADVRAEMVRARAAGELDFAAAEVFGVALPQRGSVSASDLRLARNGRR